MLPELADKIVFIGGDLRQIRAINQMSKSGKHVCVFGFNSENTDKFYDDVEIIEFLGDIKKECCAVVLPLPYSTDGENINAPFSKTDIPIAEVIKLIPPKALLLAGKCDERIKTMAEIYELKIVDYFCREELMVLNAVPTAEGAIQLAMEETTKTIHGSKCLVIGNGRIGKILSKMLSGIGASVTVAARKRKDLAQISSFGYGNMPMWNLHSEIERFDIIFNTVPYMILDYDMLSRVKRKCLIIDLASKPGGVDFSAAQRMGLKVIWALSLPGKVAPDTAGDIIKDTILNILEEEG